MKLETLLGEAIEWEETIEAQIKSGGFQYEERARRLVALDDFVAFKLPRFKFKNLLSKEKRAQVENFTRLGLQGLEHNQNEVELSALHQNSWLMHSCSPDKLPAVLSHLSAQGFRFAKDVSEALGVTHRLLNSVLENQLQGIAKQPRGLKVPYQRQQDFFCRLDDFEEEHRYEWETDKTDFCEYWGDCTHDLTGKDNWKLDPKTGEMKLVDFGHPSFAFVVSRCGNQIEELLEL